MKKIPLPGGEKLGAQAVKPRGLQSLPYHLQYARCHSERHLSPCVIPTAPPQSSMGAISTFQRKKPGSRVLVQAVEHWVQCTAEDLDGGSSDPKMLPCCALVRNRPSRAESSRNRAHPEPLGASHCHQGLHAEWRNQRLRAQEGAQCHHLGRS